MEEHGIKVGDKLINELRVKSYYLYELRLLHELRVTSCFYCTSYELLFPYELQVTVYCTSYELLLAYDLPVSVYYTSNKLLFKCQFRVVIN